MCINFLHAINIMKNDQLIINVLQLIIITYKKLLFIQITYFYVSIIICEYNNCFLLVMHFLANRLKKLKKSVLFVLHNT